MHQQHPAARRGPRARAAPAAPARRPSRAGPVTIGFSAPAADHGWIAAIAANAQAQAAKYSDVTFAPVNPTNDITQQIAAVETLINREVDALVILPNDGSQLTSLGARAMQAGIPVINLDRIFDSPLAYRTWIGGDNYGMGVSAGNYIGTAAAAAQRREPDHRARSPASTACRSPSSAARASGTRWRRSGSRSGRARPPTSPRRAGSGSPRTSCRPRPGSTRCGTTTTTRASASSPRSSRPNRSEFFMVGGAGSANAMRAIQADDTVLKATVTYSPTMAGSAVSLARLVAQGRGMSDLVEQEVPASITLASATVTKENVAQYLPLGFES